MLLPGSAMSLFQSCNLGAWRLGDQLALRAARDQHRGAPQL